MIDHLVTCLITTSPRPGHPSTEQIENTVMSVRWHLPEAQIIVACDGVRPEQEDRKAAYSEFVIRMETLCLEKWRNVRLWVSPIWIHQAQVVVRTLERIKTPLLFFCEDDLPPLSVPIPFEDMAAMIMQGKAKLIRLMLERAIPSEWKHLMLGPLELNGVPTLLMRTTQWSQRTHLASTEYYKWMVGKHVKAGDRCYLEERLYGLCDEWEDHKLCIYTPDGDMTRIWHSDGRGNDVKYESVLEDK